MKASDIKPTVMKIADERYVDRDYWFALGKSVVVAGVKQPPSSSQSEAAYFASETADTLVELTNLLGSTARANIGAFREGLRVVLYVEGLKQWEALR